MPCMRFEGLGNQTGDLVSVVDQLMTAKNQTLVVVETVSQGLLAAKMVGVSWLLGSSYEQSMATLTQRLAIKNNPDNLIATAKTIASVVLKIQALIWP